jgi:hypothetical protein
LKKKSEKNEHLLTEALQLKDILLMEKQESKVPILKDFRIYKAKFRSLKIEFKNKDLEDGVVSCKISSNDTYFYHLFI